MRHSQFGCDVMNNRANIIVFVLCVLFAIFASSSFSSSKKKFEVPHDKQSYFLQEIRIPNNEEGLR